MYLFLYHIMLQRWQEITGVNTDNSGLKCIHTKILNLGKIGKWDFEKSKCMGTAWIEICNCDCLEKNYFRFE